MMKLAYIKPVQEHQQEELLIFQILKIALVFYLPVNQVIHLVVIIKIRQKCLLTVNFVK